MPCSSSSITNDDSYYCHLTLSGWWFGPFFFPQYMEYIPTDWYFSRWLKTPTSYWYPYKSKISHKIYEKNTIIGEISMNSHHHKSPFKHIWWTFSPIEIPINIIPFYIYIYIHCISHINPYKSRISPMVPLWSQHSRCCAAALPRAAVGPRNGGRNGCGLQGLAGGGSTADGGSTTEACFPEACKVVPPKWCLLVYKCYKCYKSQ